MKTKFASLFVALTAAAFVPSAGASVITYAGSQTDLGPGWRTATVGKPLDIDGDNVFGTDGYDMVNRPAVTPSYVGSMAILTTTFPGNGGYAQIDDPTNLPGLFVTGTMNPNPGVGGSANLFQFTLNANAAGRTIRVGLMVDNLDIAAFNATSLTLVQTSGAGASSGPVATTSSIFNDRIPDWLFFDITGAAAGDTFVIQGVAGVEGTATLGGVSFDSLPPLPAHPVYALSFDGVSNTVSLSLPSPPANNYTLTAWVYLRTGGTWGGARMAVLGGTGCGESVELLIRAETESASDPQYVELGRCGDFNGDSSTSPVALDTWTHVAVTVSSAQAVNYYLDGDPSGSWTNAEYDFSLGTNVNLGDNAGPRAFDGLLTGVQIWNRVLSQSEIQSNLNQSLTGNESGLYAWYPFKEGGGGATADLAAAAGGSSGTLVNHPTWVPLVLLVTNAADSGPGTLRDAVVTPFPDTNVLFDPSLSGATILLTNGEILLTNNSLAIDASALPGGIQINGDTNSRVFEIVPGATVELDGLTITNGNATNGTGGGIVNVGTLTLNRDTFAGNTSTYEGGAIENDGTLTVNNSTFYNNTGGYGGGAIDNNAALTVIQSTLFENMSPGGGDGGAIWAGGINVLINCTVAGNVGPPGGSGIGQYDGAPIFLTNCIVALNSDVNIGGTFTGSNNITNGDPMLGPLGNYGGPTLTTLPLPGSPAIDAGSDSVTNFLATDQRGLPRLSGLDVDIGAAELQQAAVKTLPATNITTALAILNGVVIPNDLATTWHFQFGTSTSYGDTTATNALASGFSPVNEESPLRDLVPGTTYHYQIFANDGVSVKGGGDETFTTLGIGTAPRLSGVRNLGGGGVEFGFTNFSGDSFSILASTNAALPLDLWTNLGSAVELPAGSGLYQFTDPQATNYPLRFYMVHSP